MHWNIWCLLLLRMNRLHASNMLGTRDTNHVTVISLKMNFMRGYTSVCVFVPLVHYFILPMRIFAYIYMLCLDG